LEIIAVHEPRHKIIGIFSAALNLAKPKIVNSVVTGKAEDWSTAEASKFGKQEE